MNNPDEVMAAAAVVSAGIAALAIVLSIIGLVGSTRASTKAQEARNDAANAQWKMTEHLEAIAAAQAEAAQALAAGRPAGSIGIGGKLSARIISTGRRHYKLVVANVELGPFYGETWGSDSLNPRLRVTAWSAFPYDTLPGYSGDRIELLFDEWTTGMATQSAIEWTEVTWNPVTGCDRVAVGCDNCYALALAKRLKAMGAEKYQNDGNPVTSGPGFDVTIHPKSLAEPYRWSGSRVVFVNSMSDLFHARVSLDFIRDVFDVIRDTPRHTYQVLTKRAHRLERVADQLDWPDNLWMGVSVESADVTDRIDHLRRTPARTRFLSCEPLLTALPALDLTAIDWVIAGGESGPRARPMEPWWVEDIRDRCTAAGVAFFFKQWGGRTPKVNGRELGGRTWDELPQLATA